MDPGLVCCFCYLNHTVLVSGTTDSRTIMTKLCSLFDLLIQFIFIPSIDQCPYKKPTNQSTESIPLSQYMYLYLNIYLSLSLSLSQKPVMAPSQWGGDWAFYDQMFGVCSPVGTPKYNSNSTMHYPTRSPHFSFWALWPHTLGQPFLHLYGYTWATCPCIL